MAERQLTILLIDDNYAFLERMKEELGQLQIDEIRFAQSYEAAKKILDEQVPDVVLLDIQLPGKNGIELLKYIKQLSKPCQVMIVSNHADKNYRQLCMKLGAAHFFDKTLDLQLIPAAIATLKGP